MKENMGHLFSDIIGKPFSSQCVKCGIVVDWQAVRCCCAVIPECSYQYPTRSKTRDTPCGSES